VIFAFLHRGVEVDQDARERVVVGVEELVAAVLADDVLHVLVVV